MLGDFLIDHRGYPVRCIMSHKFAFTFALSLALGCTPLPPGEPDPEESTGAPGTSSGFGTTSGHPDPTTTADPHESDPGSSGGGGSGGVGSCADCSLMVAACEMTEPPGTTCDRLTGWGCEQDPCEVCDYLLEVCLTTRGCDLGALGELCAEATAGCDCEAEPTTSDTSGGSSTGEH